MAEESVRLKQVLAPKYWPLWLGLGLLRVGILLPYSRQLSLGASIGRLLQRLAKKRAQIARANLHHCFPEYSDDEIEMLLRQHFESLGIALFETAQCWWGTPAYLSSLVKEIRGLEHAIAARDNGQGVILLSAHFTSLDIGGRLLVPHFGFAPVYRKMNNLLLEFFTQRGRSKGTQGAIPKKNMRGLVRHLKSGQAIWFASDQYYKGNHSAIIKFMGRAAHSATGTPDIAKLGRAAVIPFFAYRSEGGYILELSPPLDDFPSGDVVADTERYHQIIENYIHRNPEQYLWVHRRFKGVADSPY